MATDLTTFNDNSSSSSGGSASFDGGESFHGDHSTGSSVGDGGSAAGGPSIPNIYANLPKPGEPYVPPSSGCAAGLLCQAPSTMSTMRYICDNCGGPLHNIEKLNWCGSTLHDVIDQHPTLT